MAVRVKLPLGALCFLTALVIYFTHVLFFYPVLESKEIFGVDHDSSFSQFCFITEKR